MGVLPADGAAITGLKVIQNLLQRPSFHAITEHYRVEQPEIAMIEPVVLESKLTRPGGCLSFERVESRHHVTSFPVAADKLLNPALLLSGAAHPPRQQLQQAAGQFMLPP